MNAKFNTDEFFEYQLDCWPLAQKNFDALNRVEERDLMIGTFPIRLQWNPTRVRSTGAKVDDKSIKDRTCFLCRENRPEEQYYDDNVVEGYDFLVNPYPIFPRHFTISRREHIHQDCADLMSMAYFAIKNPDLVVFYNASKSGASAPDHLHFQAGNKDFLPLCNYVGYDSKRVRPEFFPLVVRVYPELPMKFLHITITIEDEGRLRSLLDDVDRLCFDKSMRNVLMFTKKDGLLEVLVLPRKKHRPDCYYADGESNIMVSPGAVDMAGVIILPREKDFDKLTSEDINAIYKEVGVSDTELLQLANKFIETE